MSDKKKRLVIDDLRGGRNGTDPPWAIAANECVDAVNVDWYRSRCGRARNGTATVATTFSAGGPFTGKISKLIRHVPSTDETAAELWAIDDAATPVVGRMAAASTFAAPTLKDNFTGNAWDIVGATCNGKLFLAGKTAQGRLHCWDGSTVRRTGLAATVAPTAADNGAGTYAATKRYYRQRVTEQSGGVTIRRSEPSPSVSFTPSGAGTAARVTRATFPNEGETHWELEVSLDDVTYYRLATTVVGTTTYDDSAATTTYSSNPLSALTGTYTLQKSYKFIAADQNRLIGFGSYTSTDKQDDVEISAVIGSLDVGDVERVDTTGNYRIGFDENDSGAPTGLAGPVDGVYLAFKYRSFYTLTATGQSALPFRMNVGSKIIGAIPNSIAVGADNNGPLVCWMSTHGPYRWSRKGLEYIGHNIEDLLFDTTGNAAINLAASKVVSHSVFHLDKHQWWVWVTLAGNDPATLLVYDTLIGAWSRYTSGTSVISNLEKARCAVLFSNTTGATMSRDLKPYLGLSTAADSLIKADTGTQDISIGGVYDSYVLTKAFEPGGAGFNGKISDVLLMGTAGATIYTVRVFGDFNVDVAGTTAIASGTVTLPITASQAHGQGRVTGTSVGGFAFAQLQVLIDSPTSQVERLVIPTEQKEALSA